MNIHNPSQEHLTTDTLAPVAELQEYGASIIAELDRAEAELNDSENQPFSGISPQIMHDISELRKTQFDMFRQHVEIEQQYKIQNVVSEGSNVHQPGFSNIAKTLRKKEKATAGLLQKLEQFDGQLRQVMDKFETCRAAQREQESSLQNDHLHHSQPQQPQSSTTATTAHPSDDNQP